MVFVRAPIALAAVISAIGTFNNSLSLAYFWTRDTASGGRSLANQLLCLLSLSDLASILLYFTFNILLETFNVFGQMYPSLGTPTLTIVTISFQAISLLTIPVFGYPGSCWYGKPHLVFVVLFEVMTEYSVYVTAAISVSRWIVKLFVDGGVGFILVIIILGIWRVI